MKNNKETLDLELTKARVLLYSFSTIIVTFSECSYSKMSDE